MAKGNSKKKRKHKVSMGIHGGGGKGRPLSSVEKVLLGGGALARIKPIKLKPVPKEDAA